jgi:glycosyltransferase involved in cell wall biosynthesis
VAQSDAPRVSVLVTVYNREAYLRECLESILKSGLTDFELVIADDVSSDNSVSIAKRFATSDSRIRLHRNERNLGDYGNRMRAAELARGRYIKYVDSDDLIYPHGLSVMVEAMDANPAAALGISHSLPEDRCPYPWLLDPPSSWRKEFLEDGCMGSGPTGAIIRRDKFFQAAGFGSWGVLSDTDLWYRMSARWPIVLLPPGLVWWRRHEGQEFTRGDAATVYLDDGFRLAMHALTSSECPLSITDRRRAIERARHRYARKLLSAAVKGSNRNSAIRSIKKAGFSPRELMGALRPYW